MPFIVQFVEYATDEATRVAGTFPTADEALKAGLAALGAHVRSLPLTEADQRSLDSARTRRPRRRPSRTCTTWSRTRSSRATT